MNTYTTPWAIGFLDQGGSLAASSISVTFGTTPDLPEATEADIANSAEVVEQVPGDRALRRGVLYCTASGSSGGGTPEQPRGPADWSSAHAGTYSASVSVPAVGGLPCAYPSITGQLSGFVGAINAVGVEYTAPQGGVPSQTQLLNTEYWLDNC